MTDKQIEEMVNRFLNWELPKDFDPDAGISFCPNGPWPIGTNLLTAEQAREMIEYLLNVRVDGKPGVHKTDE